VRYDAVVNQRGAAASVSTSTGIVISGEYSDARAVLTITTATLSALNCLTPGGVPNNTGGATLTFLSPLN
jgi:hypothetical protein